jgi:hypothetical protein
MMTNSNYNNRPISSYLFKGKDGKLNVAALTLFISFTVTIPGIGIVLGLLAAAGWELAVGKPISSSVPPATAVAKLPKPRPIVTRNDR